MVARIRLPRRQHKYRASPCVVDGIRFPSKKEAKRYGELKLLELYSEIRALRRQVPFELRVNATLITTYVADFVYHDGRGGTTIEDVKGVKTPEYKLKKKLFEALYWPLTITEI